MILTREQALEIFKRRVSVRYYDPARKISAEDFAAILDFGRLSPSSVGCEPWQFVIVQNAALREKIKPFAWGMQASISDASHVVFLLARKHARYDSPAFEELMDRRGLTAEERAGAFERYRRFQTHDMPIADDERAEAAREKINHFLRKFILFFVSLFVTLFHFLKSDVTVAFYFTNYI